MNANASSSSLPFSPGIGRPPEQKCLYPLQGTEGQIGLARSITRAWVTAGSAGSLMITLLAEAMYFIDFGCDRGLPEKFQAGFHVASPSLRAALTNTKCRRPDPCDSAGYVTWATCRWLHRRYLAHRSRRPDSASRHLAAGDKDWRPSRCHKTAGPGV